MADKNCCNPDKFLRIFNLLLKLFTMIMNTYKKTKL